MARKERIETEVEFRPKGLSELKAKWADFAGNLLEPVVMLAAGATKAQAAWAGFRGILEGKVLGPLGLVAGASLGFLATTRMLVNQWRTLGMTAAGAMERMTLQFRPLLGSLASAKERVMELSKFAVKTPFEIDEIVEANKMLETLTQGALSNEKGMTLVGDAASVAGQSFSDTARSVGRLYDGLMSGRPVGEAAMRLQEMGIISGTVRNQMESMQAANVSGLEIWKVVEKQLQRNSGAMDAQSKSLEGLQSTYNDTKKAMEGGFSSGFLEGEKAGVIAATKVMEAMTPVMATLGKETGNFENRWEQLQLKVVEGVTSWKGFGGTVEWLIKGMVGLAAVLAGASTAAIAGFTVQLLKLMAGNKAAAASAQYLAAVEGAAIPVGTKLASVKNALQAASRANAAGMKAEAMAHLGTAAAGVKNMAATNGMVGAVKVGGTAMRGFGLAIRFVGAQLRVMAVALLANPLVWFAAAVIGVGMAISKMSQNTKEAREKLEGYQKATVALDSSMKKQISDIRTMVDLRQAEAKILTELVGAYKAVENAQNSEQKKAAENRVALLKERLVSLPATGDLEKTEAEQSLDQGQKDGTRQTLEYQRDAIAAKGPEDALRIAEERQAEVADRRRKAFDLANEEAATTARAAAARQTAVAASPERDALLRNQASIEGQLARKKEDQEKYAGMESEDSWGRKERAGEIAALEQSLEKVRGKLQEIGDVPESNALAEMLGSPSELQQIKAKIAVIDELRTAVASLATAEDAAAQNTDPKEAGKLADQVAAAKAAEARARKLADQAGVGIESPRQRQELDTRKTELESRRAEDMDPLREAEAAKARKDAEIAVATARLDSEAAVASLRLRGYEREEKLLEIERQKLAVRLQGDQLGQAEYDRQEKQLAAREAALQKEGNERRDELAGALAVSKLRRAEQEANLGGDPARAARMRAAADAVEDARARKDAEREATEANATPEERKNYVNEKVGEAQAARAAERKREEEERAAGRSRSEANQGSAVAAIEAERLKRTGKTKEARKVTEDAARKQDELDRAEAAKRYREQGFGADKADQMATRDVKISQAERMMQEMGRRGGGTVVASSLAKIGGGGNVAGTDPAVRLQERMVKLLEDIANASKENVGYDP
jgi:hypothetical protein